MFAKDRNNLQCAFDDAQRNEFIYHLLKLISLGGSKCQAEENFGPLKNEVKTMYKELLQVRKDESDKIIVFSKVYEIEECTPKSSIFLFDSPYNKCYGIVDDNGRKITLLYKLFRPFW